MLDFFKSLFSSKEEPTVDAGRTEDPEIAAAALLVETALSDGIYANIEEERILSVLMATFEKDATDTKAILDQAEDLAEDATGAHQYTKIVKELEYDKRVKLIQGLYFVSFADGEKCPYEDAFVRHVASLLHVTDRDRGDARKRAEQQT